MADAEKTDRSEDDGSLLAVEASEPTVLQEPDRSQEVGNDTLTAAPPLTSAARTEPAKRRSGFLAFMLGGALVAAAGFGVARYAFPGAGSAGEIAALQTKVDAANAAQDLLRADIATIAAQPAPDTDFADRMTKLEAALHETATIAARLTTLEDRLAAIEAVSAGGQGAPDAAVAAMGRELTALKAAVAAQKTAAPALSAGNVAANAEAQSRIEALGAAAQSSARLAALSHVRAAFATGSPLGPALAGLADLGATIPASLAGADAAVPTLLALQDSFADPARAALDASVRADMGTGWSDRLTAFLRSQSGARSLTPREGADPDAVLSRAEAALRSGDIKASLAELAALSPAGAAAMAPWVAEATRRTDTEQAISDLSATLNGQ